MRILSIAIASLLAAFISFQTVTAEELTAHEVILHSSDKVIKTLRQHDGETPEDIKELGDELLAILEGVVDFNSIAKAVMGKHYKVATNAQKQRFIPIFKNTMSYLYAKSMVKFKIVNIDVIPPSDGIDLEKKGNVSMAVTTDEGKIYSIVYTMRQDAEGNWKVRNMVLDGINLGLTYRNQFDSATLGYDGDIDKTIDNWSKEMDS
jgi:phospholipid transport system substrate-binding protein